MKRWIIYIMLFLLPLATAHSEVLRDDTSNVEIRTFNETTVKELKESPRYDYKIKESWLKKIWNKIADFLGKFINVPKTGGSEIFNAILAILAILLVILGLSRVKFRTWITGKGAKVETAYEVTDENIHEIDFDREIKDAESEGDYRKAIRLHFLRVLKNLSDSEYIYWDPNKTNYQYMYEVKGTGIYNPFTKCIHVFELVWYGEHPADIHYYNENKQHFQELASNSIKTKTAVFNG